MCLPAILLRQSPQRIRPTEYGSFPSHPSESPVAVGLPQRGNTAALQPVLLKVSVADICRQTRWHLPTNSLAFADKLVGICQQPQVEVLIYRTKNKKTLKNTEKRSAVREVRCPGGPLPGRSAAREVCCPQRTHNTEVSFVSFVETAPACFQGFNGLGQNRTLNSTAKFDSFCNEVQFTV